MTKPRMILFILSTSMLLFCAACAQKEQTYSLPPTQEEVEQLLSKHKLDWQIEDITSTSEGQRSFHLRNDADIICAVGGADKDGARGVNLMLSTPHVYDAEQTSSFFAEKWPVWYKLAAELYGSSKEAADVYKEFAAFAQDKDATVDRRVNWTKIVGENNYILNMYEINNSETYRTYEMQILNTPACRHVALNFVLYNMLQASQSDLPYLIENYATKIGINGVEQPEFDYIGTYLQNTFAPYFTEPAYERFAGHAWPGIWMHAQLPITLLELDIEESADVNDTERKQFSAKLRYGVDEATIYGYAHFSEENLIFDFAISDDSELQELLH